MKSAKLLRAELEHRNADSPVILKTLASLTDEQLVTKYAENRERGMEIQRRKVAGFGFIEILITCAIVMALAAALAVNLMKTVQVAEAKAAANTVERIGYAEFSFSNLWGPAYAAPASLTVVMNTSATPTTITCANPQMLMGQDAQIDGVAGYTITPSYGASVTPNATCPNVPLYQSYSITAKPALPTTGRWFFLTSNDPSGLPGTVHYSDGSAATVNSPVLPMAQAQQFTSNVIYSTTNGSNPPPTCTNGATNPPTCTLSSDTITMQMSTTSFPLDPSNQLWFAPTFVNGATISTAPVVIPRATLDGANNTSSATGIFPNTPAPATFAVTNYTLEMNVSEPGNVAVTLIDISAPTYSGNCGASLNQGACAAGGTDANTLHGFIAGGTTANTPAPFSVNAGLFSLKAGDAYTVLVTTSAVPSGNCIITITLGH